MPTGGGRAVRCPPWVIAGEAQVLASAAAVAAGAASRAAVAAAGAEFVAVEVAAAVADK